uniref:Uncharacterized protein n=1 Tax=Anguilla anguilla TaxID=7936 RepID=A0A0E9UGT8_ANGAN
MSWKCNYEQLSYLVYSLQCSEFKKF